MVPISYASCEFFSTYVVQAKITKASLMLRDQIWNSFTINNTTLNMSYINIVRIPYNLCLIYSASIAFHPLVPMLLFIFMYCMSAEI